MVGGCGFWGRAILYGTLSTHPDFKDEGKAGFKKAEMRYRNDRYKPK